MTKMMLMAAVALGLATAPVLAQSGSEWLNLADNGSSGSERIAEGEFHSERLASRASTDAVLAQSGSERLNLADNGSSGSERIAEGEFHSERLASRAPAYVVLD
jgi:hypothetical protein